MLKYLRSHTKTIIWIVIFCFCLWGGYAFSVSLQKKDPQGRIAGEVFGKEVPLKDFYVFYKANQIFAFGGKKPPEDKSLLHIQTWQSLIFDYEAKNQKINVSDQEVRDEVLRLLKDQKIETPTNQFYEKWLQRSFNMSAQEFEHAIREILRIQKLIVQFNSTAVEAPKAEEIRKRFDREQNSLSLDLLKFENQETANAFYEQVKTKPASLETLAKEKQIKIQNTGKVALDAILNLWQIPEATAQAMLKSAPESMTPPFAYQGKFAMAKLKEKTLADEKKFDEEYKKKTAEQLQNQHRFERFNNWLNSLQVRANFKDYTAPPPPPPAEATPSTSKSSVSAKPAAVTPAQPKASPATNKSSS